ncbi:C39 family peptidase [Halobaculum sp. MBLA0143]|uniref:C39 family peptidase n=1 Tax=Halobaculum sp. MBLA0143 TaxID=3079933 RepID=UPI003525A528
MDDAREAAAQTVKQAARREKFADWKGATLGRPTTFHARNAADGPKYVPAVYSFAVQKQEEAVGYVTTGARPGWADVIEYSRASPPQKHVGATKTRARRKGARPTGRLVYHGGVKYGVELADGRGVNVRNGRAAPLSGIDPASIESSPSASGGTLTSSREQLWGVPAWSVPNDEPEEDPDPWAHWDGCVPVAASMIISYHEGVSESQKHEYVDVLHKSMNTLHDGTTLPTDIDDGIDNFDDYGLGSRSYIGDNIYVWSHPNFVKQEIGAERPFLLNMTNGGEPDNKRGSYGDHTVAVVGYSQSGGELIIHDTWDQYAHHLDYWSWDAASYTKVRPY